MKLAISNIAWDASDEEVILQRLPQEGIAGIEVAPTKLWPEWEGARPANGRAYREKLSDLGLCVPAMQAIVFGRLDLQVFDKATHPAFFEHLDRVAELSSALGASVLVFGAPKNRARASLSHQAAWPVAVDFFQHAAERVQAHGCVIGLEANPPAYNCDFLTCLADVRDLVHDVNHPSLRPHIDSGALHISGGDGASEIVRTAPSACHYHVSEPMLAPLSKPAVDQKSLLAALARTDYQEWVSIEMRTPQSSSELWASINVTREALRAVGAA